MRGTLTSSASRLRACRRFHVLIYATAAVYFCYAPWNYLFLGASVEAARAQIAGTGRCREPLKQNKQFRHVKSGSDGSHGLLYCEDIVLTQQKVI